MSLQHEPSFICIHFFWQVCGSLSLPTECIVEILKIAFEASCRPACKKKGVLENHLWELSELEKDKHLWLSALLPAKCAHCQASDTYFLLKQESVSHPRVATSEVGGRPKVSHLHFNSEWRSRFLKKAKPI